MSFTNKSWANHRIITIITYLSFFRREAIVYKFGKIKLVVCQKAFAPDKQVIRIVTFVLKII